MTHTSLTQDDPVLKSCTFHRRIQDFVRGGGGGVPRPSWPAPHYLGEQYFVGRGGGQAPLVAMPKLARWRAQPKMEDQRKPDPEIQGIYYGLQ